MAGSRQTLRTDVVVDTGRSEAELKRLGKAADSAGADLDAMARDMKQAASTTGKGSREIARDAGKIDEALDNTKDSGLGAASALGEAFGESGSAAGAVGSMGEVVESLAESFGPLGVVVAGVGGIILGMFSASAEAAERLKEKTKEFFDALVDGQGVIDETTKRATWKKFIEENGELVASVRRLLGPQALPGLAAAINGNADAEQQLRNEVARRLTQMREEETYLQRLSLQNNGLTDAQYKRLQQLKQEIPQYEELNKTLDDTSSAFGAATEQALLFGEGVDAATAATIRAAKAGIGTAAVQGGTQQYYNYSGRAAGGPVTAGVPYTVGEYGKEVFVPATDGTIIPNGGGAMGGAVVVNMTVTSNDPVRVAQHTASALRRQAWRTGTA